MEKTCSLNQQEKVRILPWHSSNATNSSCIHLSAEECCFHFKNTKKYKLQTEATSGDEYFSLKLITTWSCSPSYLQLSAWFFSHNFSSKAHGSLWCVTEQELLHAAAFQENSSINFSREMNGKFQLKWNIQRHFCARCEVKYKWKHRKLVARPRQ